jgi:hypothetical protein
MKAAAFRVIFSECTSICYNEAATKAVFFFRCGLRSVVGSGHRDGGSTEESRRRQTGSAA